MKRKIFYLMAALAMHNFVFAQKNSLLKYLPADVSMVMNIDVKRLGEKLPPGTFRQSPIYQQMMKDPALSLDSLMSDPAKWGVDFSAGIILTVKQQGVDRYDREKQSFHLFLKLTNAETFTRTIKLLGSHEDEGENGLRVYGTDRILVSGGKFSVGWNNDILVITNAISDEMVKEMYDYHHFDDTTAVMDTGAISEKMPDYEGMMARYRKSQRNLLFQLLTPNKITSFSTNTHFLTAMSSEADIKIWNGGNINPLPKGILPYTQILKKFKSFGEKNSITLVNFENGKIVSQSRNFPGETITGIYKKYIPAPSNFDLVRRLPAGTLLGLANLSMNQDLASEMIKKSGLSEILDSLKKEIPFDAGLLRGVFKSQLMIAVIKSNDPDDQFTKHKGMKLILALPIADKTKFQQLKTIVPGLLDSIKQAKGEEFKDPGFFAKNNDELLVISLDPETALAFLNNTGKAEVPNWISAYSKYPMLVNINFREMMSNLLSKKMDDEKTGALAGLLNTFDKMVVYGGEYEDQSIKSTMELGFADQDKNALTQLFDMLNSMAKTKKDQKFRIDEYILPKDTTVAMTSGLTVPDFKDPEVQQFANEYVLFMELYKESFEKKDSTRMMEFGVQSEIMMKRAEKLIDKLAKDIVEMQKFTDLMTAAADYLISSLKLEEKIEPPPPPPPPPPAKTQKTKVNPKKLPPPVLKNN